MLSNAYFLAKFRFDTAENEPAKNLQKFAKFANFADANPLRAASRPGQGGAGRGRAVGRAAARDHPCAAKFLPTPRSYKFLRTYSFTQAVYIFLMTCLRSLLRTFWNNME